ncbi:MAG: DNA translocase FtsK [Caldilineaceae bacterium]
MASKKPTSSSKSPPAHSVIDMFLDGLQRAEVIGLLLVLTAAFTLLSLATGSRGAITGAWIDLLRSFLGSGAWLFPIAAGGLGLAIVLRAIEKLPDLPWMRPVGTVVLMLAYVTAATLFFPVEARSILAAQGEAGGTIGLWVATALQDALTIIGAWGIVLFLIVAGVIFLTDQWLINASAIAYLAVSAWMQQRRYEPILSRPTIQPALPLPSGELPWWVRLRERWLGWLPAKKAPEIEEFPDHPAPFVPAEPPVNQPVSRYVATPAQAAEQVAGNGTVRTTTTPLKNEGEKQPRIIGESFTVGQQSGPAKEWRLPKLEEMLQNWDRRTESDERIRQQGRLIQETLELFGVPADFEGAYKGPSVTQYLIKPGYTERNIKGEQQRIKVKVAKIASLSNDLALALAAPSVRIEAPIPGTSYVGIEVPNQESNVVGLKELMESETFTNVKGRLRIALGEDVKGQSICSDLARMPHLLIAGATGSGKSVCVNSIISCLLLTMTPDDLRFLMVDPKMVELSVYNGIPHLLSPVVTEVDKAAQVLFWAVKEMERRYSLCSKVGARDIIRYNEYLAKRNEKKLPYIVVIVDEMADLMMAAPEEVEKHICRLAQMARAIGIHLIIATQRPSVDVITGLIKANFPARIAFAVTSQTDSRVILDVPGADRLLGRGDMLFMAPDASKLERLQGTWLSDDEINRIVRYWKGIRMLEGANGAPWEGINLDASATTESAQPLSGEAKNASPSLPDPTPVPPTEYDQIPLLEQVKQMKVEDGRDPLFEDAARVVREAGRGSISLLQRELRIGYNRATRIVEQLEEARILGPDPGGAQGREVLDYGRGDSNGKPRIVGGGGEDDPAKPRVWF